PVRPRARPGAPRGVRTHLVGGRGVGGGAARAETVATGPRHRRPGVRPHPDPRGHAHARRRQAPRVRPRPAPGPPAGAGRGLGHRTPARRGDVRRGRRRSGGASPRPRLHQGVGPHPGVRRGAVATRPPGPPPGLRPPHARARRGARLPHAGSGHPVPPPVVRRGRGGCGWPPPPGAGAGVRGRVPAVRDRAQDQVGRPARPGRLLLGPAVAGVRGLDRRARRGRGLGPGRRRRARAATGSPERGRPGPAGAHAAAGVGRARPAPGHPGHPAHRPVGRAPPGALPGDPPHHPGGAADMTTRSVPWAPGRLPGIGHAHRLLGDPLPLLRELPELGPVVRVGLGPRTLYMVTTPELLRSIGLGTAGRCHREDLIEPIAPFAGRTLVTLSGDAHRRRRRQIAPAFHRNRIATYAPAFARIARQWVSELPVGEPIDLAPEADRLSLATLTSTLIAADVGSEALAAVRVDSPLLLAEASFRTILPRAFWRLRPGADRRYHASAARLRGMLETVVVDYRRSGRDPGDLLSGLLMHTGPGSGDVLDDEAVIDELVGFLMGGIESPAGIFVALIPELVRAPGVRDRVIAEVDEVVGDGPVAAEHATALPYLRNTLLETMRLWSAWINMLTADGPVSLGDV